MLLWSYFSVVFTDPGGVPPNWRPAVDEEGGDNDPLTASEFPLDSENGRIRFCRKCNQLKPPRCHHCSVCELLLLQVLFDCWLAFLVFSLLFFFFLSVNDVLLDYLVRWKVCPEDGPSLCLGCQLCWGIELQKFPPLPGMFCNLLSFIFAVPIILSLFAPSIGTTWLSMLFYHYQYFHLWIFFISRSCLRWSHGDIEHNLGMIL